MKKIYSRCFRLVAAVLFALCAVLPLAAEPSISAAATAIAPSQSAVNKAGQSTFVYDGANVLTAAQRNQLSQTLVAIYQKYGTAVSVVTLQNKYSDRDLANFAKGYADKLAAKAKNGAIIFAQDTASRRWNISTDRVMMAAVPDTKYIEYMSKAVVPFLKQNDSANAYAAFAFQAADLIAAQKATGRAMDLKNPQMIAPSALGLSVARPQAAVASAPNKAVQTSGPQKKEVPVTALSVALLIGSSVAYAYSAHARAARRAKMSNVAFASNAANYVKNGSFRLTGQRDIYLRDSVTVTKLNSSSNSNNSGRVTHNASDNRHTSGGGGY